MTAPTLLFACPMSGEPLSETDWTTPSGRTYPVLDGIPILTSAPGLHTNQPRLPEPGDLALPTDIRRGIPDAVTPHQPPAAMGAPGMFGAWLRTLTRKLPADRVLEWATRHAPDGPCLDVGCGVGQMVLKMARTGRVVYACDASADAVRLTRDTLTGRLRRAAVPTHRGGYRWMPFPYPPISGDDLHLCIAEPDLLPFRQASFAWVHLDAFPVLDGLHRAIPAAAACLVPGGLLTIATAYDSENAPILHAEEPESGTRDAIDAAGLLTLEDELAVPAVVREYDRGYRVLFTHCMAARRPGDGVS